MNQACYKCGKPNKNERRFQSSGCAGSTWLNGNQRRPAVATGTAHP